MIINNIIARFALPVFSNLPRNGSKIALERRQKPLRDQWLFLFSDIFRTRLEICLGPLINYIWWYLICIFLAVYEKSKAIRAPYDWDDVYCAPWQKKIFVSLNYPRFTRSGTWYYLLKMLMSRNCSIQAITIRFKENSISLIPRLKGTPSNSCPLFLQIKIYINCNQ